MNKLNPQAKFLKACGTLVETPVEIRKALSKFNSSPLHNADLEPPNYTSIMKLEKENQPDMPPTPIRLFFTRSLDMPLIFCITLGINCHLSLSTWLCILFGL